ncbi:cadmium resistance transporter [Fructilactobacillus myrtifloralis]|uniref:Cadmium resistance transporter n=1 Tax=Fructilactobacillus myrtifloralis TaxID=2940301 RepID=A0ABY5BN77_9LACO|nr:cadmium resistance transporter [Fructilactobacillus myrtifloralis]USS84562.1 cadmium resistance transporter [Fructilactobacillus myrtifloralis]
MNWWLMTLTFLAVNLDFFVILLFFLQKYSFGEVLLGYLLGLWLLLVLSYGLGQTLAHWLPEWVLGGLGFLPLYLAFRTEDDDAELTRFRKSTPVLTVLGTYLVVCAGCNLSVFIPVLLGQTWPVFLLTLGYFGFLTVIVVLFLWRLGRIPVVTRFLHNDGEWLLRVTYFVIGIYVLYDSGFLAHVWELIR